MTAHRRQLGFDGEAAVAAWYAHRGYTVVAQNWRCSDGEIDLVLSRADVIAVCEVKTRTSGRFGAPIEAITPPKLARLRRLAARFVRESSVHASRLRIDIASAKPHPDGSFAISVVEGVG